MTRSKRLPSLVAATLAVLVGATGCSGVYVTTDYDPAASFAGLDTYAWLPAPQAETGDLRIDNDILDSRIRAAVEAEFEARGYRPSEPDAASFWIAYHAALENQIDVRTFDDRYAYGPHWTSSRQTYVYEYEVGTLILDVVQPDSQRLVWRGTAEAEVIRSMNMAERDERLRTAVGKMLDQFPPR